jgi:hypothetical protein
MQLNVLQLKRSLYITFMLYSSKIWWDFSFHQKTKFFLTANNFLSPLTKLIYAMFIRKVFGSDKISYFDRHQKKQWGVWGGDFLWFEYIDMLYFVLSKKGGTKYYGLSLFAQKLLRFILFYLKNARANNVLV